MHPKKAKRKAGKVAKRLAFLHATIPSLRGKSVGSVPLADAEKAARQAAAPKLPDGSPRFLD